MSKTLAHSLEAALQYHERGDFDSAERCYREALIEDPHDMKTVHAAGVLALQAGNFDLAVARLRWALELGTTLPGTYFLLGRAHKGRGDLDDAIESYRAAIARDPAMVDAYISLGLALKDRGLLDEAIAVYHAALLYRPDSFEAAINLGNALQLQGRLDEALAAYDRAALRQDSALVHYNRGKVLRAQRRDSDAAECFQRAIVLDPDYLDAYFNLGNTLSSIGRYDQSVQCFHYLLDLIEAGAGRPYASPEREALRRNTRTALVAPLVWSWRTEEASVLLGEALAREPDSLVLAEYRLLVLPHRCERQGELLELYRHFQRLAPMSGIPPLATSPREADPDRLRIGYVSGDLYDHSVAFFIEPLLANHDRAAFEILCYSSNRSDDDVTARLKAHADAWIDAGSLDDAALSRRIADDGVDVLIDLSGRTERHRLGVFASRPAFVQLSYLGYPTYSGVPQIDWRITDAVIDPPGEPGLEAEFPMRLPRSMFCYRPPADAPEPAHRRAGEGGICFGSFNQMQKLSPAVLAVWARILAALPGSRLLLKAHAFADDGARRRVLDAFMDAGVDPGRVSILAGTADRREHLALYNTIDIALDTFPYNGATTSCEALWMGVPLITLAGETHPSRMGASLLSALDLPELIARSVEEYIAVALRLARSPAALDELHANLRARFAASSLRDEAGFARDFEHALRTAWRSRVS